MQSDDNVPRRRSTRDIKRKKFDDEIFESDWKPGKKKPSTPPPAEVSVPPAAPKSQVKQPAPASVAPSLTPQPQAQAGRPQAAPKASPVPSSSTPTGNAPKRPQRRKQPSTSGGSTPGVSRRKKESLESSQSPAALDVGRWQPSDDLALITAVLQCNDLQSVHQSMKFTCKFTQEEVNRRWYALLYDRPISKAATDAIRNLHPEEIIEIQSKTIFSEAEERVLAEIMSTSEPKPTLESMEDLLSQHGDVFHPARNGRMLLQHWQLMKQYKLLNDQTVVPTTSGSSKVSFSGVEDSVKDEFSRNPPAATAAMSESAAAADAEVSVARRRGQQDMVRLEAELPRWQVIVEHITGISPPDFSSRTVAILRGRIVRYLMRDREITLGRSTKDATVDVDVSLEGPAWKVSRKQATIKMRATGEFFISNDGRRPIFIDGSPCLTGSKTRLNNNSVLEISCLRFVFLINQELISHVQDEVTKLLLVPS